MMNNMSVMGAIIKVEVAAAARRACPQGAPDPFAAMQAQQLAQLQLVCSRPRRPLCCECHRESPTGSTCRNAGKDGTWEVEAHPEHFQPHRQTHHLVVSEGRSIIRVCVSVISPQFRADGCWALQVQMTQESLAAQVAQMRAAAKSLPGLPPPAGTLLRSVDCRCLFQLATTLLFASVHPWLRHWKTRIFLLAAALKVCAP